MTMTIACATNRIKLVTKISRADREELTALPGGEYRGNSAVGYMVTGDGKIITTDKPQIVKSFWFGENGSDFQEQVELTRTASRDREYFKRKNLKRAGYYKTLANIEAALSGTAYFFLFNAWGSGSRFYEVRCFAKDQLLHPHTQLVLKSADSVMTREELEAYKELIEAALKVFDRRLNTYLKRYGLSKCSYDTYWVDR
ncbi:MAG: hypothetical protein E6X32_01695 [Varibaculum cambriense]|uniref:hypothetical protein n=1 Tax=Varibaculum cambriense TaxID=184870 RepID=UPI00290CAB09|nr:hypothetical protein [Varibaculum cambriense]MDU4944309.1 hypothetical protein [Varibaculum cambriense]